LARAIVFGEIGLSKDELLILAKSVNIDDGDMW